MEQEPKPEIALPVTFDEALEAKNSFAAFLRETLPGVPIGVGVGLIEGGCAVAIRVQESDLATASELIEAHLQGLPIDLQIDGLPQAGLPPAS